jgi:hypothetical protein
LSRSVRRGRPSTGVIEYGAVVVARSISSLIDFLDSGEAIENFPDNYPGVTREQIFAFMEEASQALVAKIA